MTSITRPIHETDLQTGTGTGGGRSRKDEEGRVLMNRTSLFPMDTFISPPKASKLNAFTLMETRARSLQPPLAKLARELAQKIPRQKREDQKTVLLTLNVLFKNFLLCWETNQWASIQGANSAFSKGTQYEQMGLGRNSMRDCLTLLVTEGYVQKIQYDYQKRQTSLYYPAQPLQAIFLDCLYLPYKGPHKCGVFVSDGKVKQTANLQSDHAELIAIRQLHEVFKDQRLPKYSPLQLIYNNSTNDPFPLYGGRLYTNTQQIPMHDSPIRKHTTINREACCEVDLSANHLRMSAALFGEMLCDDPYLELKNIAEVKSRDDVKRVVASLISTKVTETHKAKHSLFKPGKERLASIPPTTFDAIYQATYQLFPWFESVRGIGANLQSIEGQILLESMSQLLEEGIIAIPLHDALRVPIQHQAKAEKILKEVWSRHLGVEFETKVTFKIH
jgi:hypothetical protein